MEGSSTASAAAVPVVTPVWKEPPSVPAEPVRRLQAALSLPTPLCALLVARGHDDPERAKSFLRPLLTDLHPPGLLADAEQATRRILDAIDGGETILIHGDYDVDGVAGTALLTRWIRKLGGRAVPFVPHRVRDGYDFGRGGLDAARQAGASLIVTVDSGIRAHQAVAEANADGLDVIVTDHHTPAETLPPALAVVNPNRSDCAYPNKGLCGTGVAFRLCELLAQARGHDPQELHASLDLVALATIADVVPLEKENRTLVRFGLKALERTASPGLRALMSRADLQAGAVDAGQVAFRLAPRINAVGRMAEAMTALELLLTDDPKRAAELAGVLEKANAGRRDEEQRILNQALDRLAESYDPESDFGVVLEAEGWHPGVIGIVASRIVERIHRPTVLIALRDGQGRGSARSIPGFDLLGAVQACGEHLGRFGGHRAAAGMDVAAERIDDFRTAFNDEARERLGGQPPRPSLRPEIEIRLADATLELAHLLSYVGPFGLGNPSPLWIARNVELKRPAREVGKGHLKLQLDQSGDSLDAVGFGLADRISPESLGTGPLDVIFKLKVNDFRGRRRAEAHVLDVRRSGGGEEPVRDPA